MILDRMAAARLLWDAQRPDADRIDFDRIDRVSLDGWLRMGDVLLQMAVARDDARTRLARVEAERDEAVAMLGEAVKRIEWGGLDDNLKPRIDALLAKGGAK